MKTWNDLKVRNKLMILMTLFFLALVVVVAKSRAGIHSGFLS